MTFWFYLSGASSGVLSIIVKDLKTNETHKTWEYSGLTSLSDQWIYATFGFYIANPYKIWIQASRSSTNGFVAVDDIFFRESFFCNVLPPSASVGESSLTTLNQYTSKEPFTGIPSEFDCDFESGFCNWNQLQETNIKWTRQRGNTPSLETGPTVDHT